MGLTPSQGELGVALRPIFANIKGVHVIHDDVIVGHMGRTRSNSDLISNFAKKSAPSREMTKGENISDGKINNNSVSKNWLRNL